MMTRQTTAMLYALGLMSATLMLPQAPAHAQLPAKPAPQGMLQVANSTGRVLTSHMGGTRSAHKMLQALKMISGEYFDKPMVLTRAFADEDDQYVQAAFTASLKGVPVRGVVSVVMQGDSGQGTLLFDNAKTFARSFRNMNGTGGPQGRGGKAAKVTLTRQNAPDGSCQISLPAGYRIVGAYKGTLDIVGPNGAYMAMGGIAVCTSRQAAGMFPGMPAVDFNDPVRAMIDYVGFMGRKAGTPINLRILDTKPVSHWTTGRASFVRYTLQMKEKSNEGFGLFCVAQTGENQAMFYQTFINAPTATYRSQFPGMMQAWGTWSINPSVFTERLMAAAQTMRGMSDILTSSDAYRQKTYDRVNEAWDDYIRDQGTWQNPGTGARYKVPMSVTTPTVNGTALQPVPLSNL